MKSVRNPNKTESKMVKGKKGRKKGLPQNLGREGEEGGEIPNDRIVYKQIELCCQSVPSWGRGEPTEKPIWHGLRKKPYVIPRKKRHFSVFINNLGWIS